MQVIAGNAKQLKTNQINKLTYIDMCDMICHHRQRRGGAKQPVEKCNNMGLLNIEQIRDGLFAGTIDIDLAGHRSHDKEYLYKSLIERLSRLIEYCYQKKDERRQEWFDFEMRLLTAGEQIGLLGGLEAHCFGCGCDLPYILKDANTITVGLTYEQQKDNETDNTCPMKDQGKSFSFEIRVESGKLVFANYFDDRRTDDQGNEVEIFEPEDKYARKFSLNCALGRMNRTKYYAVQHNIAYAQMGNMSIGVFVNKARDGIIIGDTERRSIKSHKFVADISLAMWRWMAADLAVLEKHGIVPDEDSIVLDVVNGVYRVTNYYEFFDSWGESPIYSTLIRVGELNQIK